MFLYLLLKSSKYDISEILKIIEKEDLMNEIDTLLIDLVQLKTEMGRHTVKKTTIYALPSTPLKTYP